VHTIASQRSLKNSLSDIVTNKILQKATELKQEDSLQKRTNKNRVFQSQKPPLASHTEESSADSNLSASSRPRSKLLNPSKNDISQRNAPAGRFNSKADPEQQQADQTSGNHGLLTV
jgi:hypothetical protein